MALKTGARETDLGHVRRAILAALLATLVLPASSSAQGRAGVAALQVALRSHALYSATIDGIRGPATSAALRQFERRHNLKEDGIVDRRVRRRLGPLGRWRLNSRFVRQGLVGWDVSALQFLAAWHGFPSGTFDGRFDASVDAAVRRFQAFHGLTADGIVGPATLRMLRADPPAPPRRLRWPLAPVEPSSVFGPRGDRFHTGVDLPAPTGRTVRTPRRGRVVSAGWDATGYGKLVVVAHRSGVQSFYAHLSSIAVEPGQWLAANSKLGGVGATGAATGPHLHFEVRLRGAALDPLPGLRRST